MNVICLDQAVTIFNLNAFFVSNWFSFFPKLDCSKMDFPKFDKSYELSFLGGSSCRRKKLKIVPRRELRPARRQKKTESDGGTMNL